MVMKCSRLIPAVVTVTLAALTVGAHAEKQSNWEAVGDNHTAVIYLDLNRIRESVIYPRVWQLHDLSEPTSSGVHSRKVFVEYDCKGAKRRTIASSSHTEAMGKGRPKFVSTREGPWQVVYADTVDEEILVRLCGQSNKRKMTAKGGGHGAEGHGDAKAEGHGEAKSEGHEAAPAASH